MLDYILLLVKCKYAIPEWTSIIILRTHTKIYMIGKFLQKIHKAGHRLKILLHKPIKIIAM